MLTSQGLIFATAMAISAGTIILFDHFREKYFHQTQNQESAPDQNPVLKSCLSSESKKEQRRKKKKKKKRVRFANDVKDSSSNGELYRRERRRSAEIRSSCCGSEILGVDQKMPANRVALYSGILKDRVQRIECSY